MSKSILSSLLSRSVLSLSLILTLGVTACKDTSTTTATDSQDNTEVVGMEEETPDKASEEFVPTKLVITSEGIQAIDEASGKSENLPFGIESDRAKALVLSVLGEPRDSGEGGDFPGEYVNWDNGFSITIRDGEFSSWGLRAPYDGNSETDITTVEGIGIGSTKSELEDVYPVEVRETTLGIEFYAGSFGGLLTENGPNGKIQDLWNGEVNFAR